MSFPERPRRYFTLAITMSTVLALLAMWAGGVHWTDALDVFEGVLCGFMLAIVIARHREDKRERIGRGREDKGL